LLVRARVKKHLRNTTLYRRAPFIVSYWSGNSLVFENFLTGRRVASTPQAAAILHFFDRWRSPRELIVHLGEYEPSSVQRAIALLHEHSFLQRSGEICPPREQALKNWREWNPAAGFFHLSTKDVEFYQEPEEEFRCVLLLAKLHAAPKPYKRYRRVAQVCLPKPNVDGEFPRVLLSRRTWRTFSAKPVGLPELSTLLSLTWGIQGWANVPRLGSAALKTSPSGGALHPVEAYLLTRKVRGLRPGLYHYDGAAHCLDLLQRGANSRQIAKYLAGQSWFGDASFVVFMTAVFARTQWKYDYPRAYRAVLMEAGHLCQTFCLTATWLGLAPFCTIAFNDSSIERLLGVDGISESVLYVAGAGTRPPDERQAHLGTMGVRIRWRH
jgi:SagB-type dehydrogenase family enzyme